MNDKQHFEFPTTQDAFQYFDQCLLWLLTYSQFKQRLISKLHPGNEQYNRTSLVEGYWQYCTV